MSSEFRGGEYGFELGVCSWTASPFLGGDWACIEDSSSSSSSVCPLFRFFNANNLCFRFSASADSDMLLVVKRPLISTEYQKLGENPNPAYPNALTDRPALRNLNQLEMADNESACANRSNERGKQRR